MSLFGGLVFLGVCTVVYFSAVATRLKSGASTVQPITVRPAGREPVSWPVGIPLQPERPSERRLLLEKISTFGRENLPRPPVPDDPHTIYGRTPSVSALQEVLISTDQRR